MSFYNFNLKMPDKFLPFLILSIFELTDTNKIIFLKLINLTSDFNTFYSIYFIQFNLDRDLI